MKVYKRKETSPFKWVFAAIVFVIALTFTLAEVNGFNFPNRPGDKDRDNKDGHSRYDQQFDRDGNDHHHYCPPDSTNNNPGAVPEPTTLLLMAGGLGVALLRKNRKAE